ncbi:hypothetical protein GCM10011369_32960 [Neiella marina]|uniref:Uncharacterized protein n=1 Tax=Neiella marina TaxID=508461 RepID=A0A8J2U9T5_9GAMM|nr:hypothetical protein GCM10011369_32960 [Neiella marina]
MYNEATCLIGNIFSNGAAVSGTKAVTATGTVSVTHQTAIITANPVVTQAVADNAAVGGGSTMVTNRHARPSHKPQ